MGPGGGRTQVCAEGVADGMLQVPVEPDGVPPQRLSRGSARPAVFSRAAHPAMKQAGEAVRRERAQGVDLGQAGERRRPAFESDGHAAADGLGRSARIRLVAGQSERVDQFRPDPRLRLRARAFEFRGRARSLSPEGGLHRRPRTSHVGFGTVQPRDHPVEHREREDERAPLDDHVVLELGGDRRQAPGHRRGEDRPLRAHEGGPDVRLQRGEAASRSRFQVASILAFSAAAADTGNTSGAAATPSTFATVDATKAQRLRAFRRVHQVDLVEDEG